MKKALWVALALAIPGGLVAGGLWLLYKRRRAHDQPFTVAGSGDAAQAPPRRLAPAES